MRTVKSIINQENLINLLSELNIENKQSVIKEIESSIKNILNQNKPKIVDIPEDAKPFLEVYPDFDLNTLPSWLRENIQGAFVIGRSRKNVLIKDGRKYQLNNSLNHLSGGEWTFFTNSILNTRYLTTGEESCAHNIRKIHPTPKPPLLMRDIIKFFTKENEIVLDYFMGVGGSLIGASMAGRRAIGIELNTSYVSTYRNAAQLMGLPEQQTLLGDALEILKTRKQIVSLLGKENISLVLIDPPYSNMMSRVKTGADIKIYGQKPTPFTDLEKDLGNMEKELYFDSLKKSVQLSMQYLKHKGYVVIFMKDLQPNKNNPNLLHADVVNKINEIEDIQFMGLRIWADQTVKLFPYGYPFSFVANQIHQYILVFRKIN